MKSTIRFLMATVILLPIAAYFLGTPPNQTQLSILKSTAWIVLGVIAYTFMVGIKKSNKNKLIKCGYLFNIHLQNI